MACAAQRQRIRIEQQLAGVETQAFSRREAAMNVVGVGLPEADAVDQDMPDVPGSVLRRIEIDGGERRREDRRQGVTLTPFGPRPTGTVAMTFQVLTSRTETEFA